MVFVIGEYVIDLVDDGNNRYDIHLGGCGLNAAVACIKHDVPTAFLSPISQDANGLKVIDYLVEQELLFDPELCNNSAPSTLALATIQESGSAKYDFYIKNTASMVMQSEQLLNALSMHSDIKVIHVGSLSMLMNPTSSAILDVLSFKTPKPIIFVDPNIRAQEVVKIPNWEKKLNDFFEIANIIKLSDEDLSFIYKGLSIEEAVAKIKTINKDVHIVITKGSKGATWITPKDDVYNQDNYEIEVVDTIGAGDTFSGSLLAYLSKNSVFGDDGESPKFRLNESVIKSALKYACYSASLNCSKNGCNPPTCDEVESIINK